MRVIGERVVAINDLKTNLFVRQSLDDDHVLYLAGLVANGVVLDPIEVIEDLSVVDGRHRRECYFISDVNDTRVKILRFDSEAEMIAYAFRKNTGGAKPPTTSDIEHTVELLLEKKESIKAIAEHLQFPVGLIRKYVQQVKDRLVRTNMMRAAAAVTDGGKRVAEAAELFNVDIEKLKEHLSGRKKKRKNNGISEMVQYMTFYYRSAGQKNANAMRKLTIQYDDGDVTAKQVQEIIDHLKDLQKKQARAVLDWEARFNAKFEAAKNVEPIAKSA